MNAHPSGLRVRKPDLTRSRPARFAWHQRIVLGYLNLLLGNEGAGKGVLVCWMFAMLTRGELPGDLFGKPAMVGILADEDSHDDVWTPRLSVARADFDYIRYIDRTDQLPVELGEDRDKLKLATELEGVEVLYLDALLDNLGVNVNDWRSKEVRHALQPARSIAREFGVAVLGAMHPNKKADSFRQLVAGASAFNALSRSSLLLADHPDDKERRVLCRGKGNLSAVPRAFEFDIASARFAANGFDFNEPQAVDIGESDLTIDDLMDTSTPAPAGEARTAARDLISAALADGAWHPVKPILIECGEQDIHDRAARRAANDIGIEIERRGFPAASWWRLPQSGHRLSSVVSDRTVPTVSTGDRSQDRQDSKDSLQVGKSPVRTDVRNGHKPENALVFDDGGES